MAFRGVEERAATCSQCQAGSVARCGRCDEPLCDEHRPRPRQHCARCEEEYDPYVRSRASFVWSMALAGALAMGGSAVHELVAGAGPVPLWLLVGLFATGYGSVEAYYLVRRYWRRRRFLAERARRLGGARQLVIPLSAGSAAAWWLGKLLFWWWLGTMVAAVAFMAVGQVVSAGVMLYVPLIVLSGAWLAAGLIAIGALYLWPPSWRGLVIFGDRLQVRGGTGAMLLDIPVAEADLGRAYYRQNTGGKRNAIRYHPVITIRGDRLGTMTLFCGEVSVREAPAGLPRVRFPRVRVAEDHWPVLLERLGLSDAG